jgi:hypothetical protein
MPKKILCLTAILLLASMPQIRIKAVSEIEKTNTNQPWISQINYATPTKNSSCQDCNGLSKWIEIYNPSSGDIDLTGYKTQTGLKNQQTIKGLIIPAGGVGYLESNLNKNSDLDVDNKVKATIGSVGAKETGYTIDLINPSGQVVSSQYSTISQSGYKLSSVIFCKNNQEGKLSQNTISTLSNGIQLQATLNQTPSQKPECKEDQVALPKDIVTPQTPINVDNKKSAINPTKTIVEDQTNQVSNKQIDLPEQTAVDNTLQNTPFQQANTQNIDNVETENSRVNQKALEQKNLEEIKNLNNFNSKVGGENNAEEFKDQNLVPNNSQVNSQTNPQPELSKNDSDKEVIVQESKNLNTNFEASERTSNQVINAEANNKTETLVKSENIKIAKGESNSIDQNDNLPNNLEIVRESFSQTDVSNDIEPI